MDEVVVASSGSSNLDAVIHCNHNPVEVACHRPLSPLPNMYWVPVVFEMVVGGSVGAYMGAMGWSVLPWYATAMGHILSNGSQNTPFCEAGHFSA
mmetsp:Transcript_18701/g.38671  ORF Transcript_18701/g.38671 Transcript_18701/m.38671 type:complete len:95 (+) Transcript_18701:1448-1732(+)